MLKTDAPTDSADDVSTRRATRLIERDVEAPEVFQVTEAGLWDGRPSLGGVWVAHPDVKEPERVLIRNTANDKFVIGALFRRERENPGPRFQISSDAAAALGILAGSPQNLNVTALRREEVPQAEPLAEASPATDDAAPDTIATAATAIDRADGRTEGGAAPTADATIVASADTLPEPAPKKQGFFAKLFGKKDQPENEVALTAAPAAAGSLAAPAVETAAIGPAAPGAAAPAPRAPVVQKASVPAPAPKHASGLAKPYLQIGIFSVEENARNTATAMRQAGMIPTVREQSTKGKVFWRVLIGPATSKSEQDSLLKKVRATGFTDAYAVTN